MFTRRTATVIISAPDASCARTITAGEEYLPVPTINRDVNVLSAVVRRSMVLLAGSAAGEVHDLHLVALGDARRVEPAALEHDAIGLDGDAPRIDRQLTEERRHRQRAG